MNSTSSLEAIAPRQQGWRRAAFRLLARIDLIPWLVALLVIAVVAPILLVFYGALTNVAIGDAFAGFTFENFITVFTRSEYLRAFLNTLLVAFSSTAVAGLIGIPLSWLLVRTDVPWRGVLRVGIMVPFFLSPFIGALAWTLLLQHDAGPVNLVLVALGLHQINAYSVQMIIWVMGLYYSPYLFLFVSSALYNVDPAMEEAGHLSGLDRLQVIIHITVPLVAPAVMSGILLTLVTTAGDFGIPALLGTQARFFVMTTYIYQLLNQFPTQYNVAAALGIVILVAACVGLWFQNRLARGRSFVTLTGKGFRPRIIELGPFRWVGLAFAVIFIMLSAILPIGMLAWVSLVQLYDATFSFSEISLVNFRKIFIDRGPLVNPAILHTLFLSVTAAAIAVMLAVAVNWVLYRTRSIFRRPLEFVLLLPAAVPHVVLGVGMLWTYIFVPLPIYGTIWILLIGYVAAFITQAVRNVGSTFVQIDSSLEEAATMVGATRLRVIREVTLPLLKPGLVSAWTLLFIIFARELSTSIFLYSPGNEVLSVLMFNMWTEGAWGEISAVAMVQIAIVGAVVVLASTLFGVNITRAPAGDR